MCGEMSKHLLKSLMLTSFIFDSKCSPGLAWREKPKTVLGIKFGAPHDTTVGGCHFRQNQKSIQHPSTGVVPPCKQGTTTGCAIRFLSSVQGHLLCHEQLQKQTRTWEDDVCGGACSPWCQTCAIHARGI
jgi:hypothetical protein